VTSKKSSVARVIVCGDRNWEDSGKILGRLTRLPSDTTIISGHCRGADKLGEASAKLLGLKLEVYPAYWKEEGKAAGVLRNQRMLDTGADLVIAFHSNINRSVGTRDMLTRATKAGVPTELIR
jgi:hypothetical protein